MQPANLGEGVHGQQGSRGYHVADEELAKLLACGTGQGGPQQRAACRSLRPNHRYHTTRFHSQPHPHLNRALNALSSLASDACHRSNSSSCTSSGSRGGPLGPSASAAERPVLALWRRRGRGRGRGRGHVYI